MKSRLLGGGAGGILGGGTGGMKTGAKQPGPMNRKVGVESTTRQSARAKAQAPSKTALANLPNEYLVPTIAADVREKLGAEFAEMTEKLRAEVDTLLKSKSVEAMMSEAKAIASKMTEEAMIDDLAAIIDKIHSIQNQVSSSLAQIDGLRSSDSELSRSLENVQSTLTGIEAEMGSLADRIQLLEHLSARVGTVEDRIQKLAASTEAARMAAEASRMAAEGANSTAETARSMAEAARSMAEESTMQSETRARRLQVDLDGRVHMDTLEAIVSEKVEAAIAKEKEGIKKNKSAIKRIFSYLEDTVNPELGRLRKDVDEMRELLVHKGSMA